MSLSSPETNASGSQFRIWLFILFLLYSNFLYTSEDSDLEKILAEKLSLEDLADLKRKNTASETKSKANIDTESTVTNNEVVEEFAERLGIKKFTENKEEWEKFYKFAGSNFTWPLTMKYAERYEVFDYIVAPCWEPNGEELAKNTIKYRCLLESGTLDKSQGSHILLINGRLVEYGREISSEDDEELGRKYPGCFYVPVVERFGNLRRFSANNDQEKSGRNEVRMANIQQNFRMVIDTGATMTIIPYFLRQQLYSPNDGWKRNCFYPDGYGNEAKVCQASREWLVCLGDGTTGLGQMRFTLGKKIPLMSTVV